MLSALAAVRAVRGGDECRSPGASCSEEPDSHARRAGVFAVAT